MNICVIIPMKDPSEAKSRLENRLPHAARAALARTLFRNLLSVLGKIAAQPTILVVSSSPAIRAICSSADVACIDDPSGDLNAAVTAGARHAADLGHRSVCVLPGDLADPSIADLDALFALPRNFESVIVSPAHDGGTNALIVTPPTGLAFAYGPQSSLEHQRRAEASGMAVIVAPLDSLLYDVDTQADLGERLTRGLQRAFGEKTERRS
ncbi:MAG: 2-phospho-L-lactate guanylyltransferase [Pseudomonadota bacterium]